MEDRFRFRQPIFKDDKFWKFNYFNIYDNNRVSEDYGGHRCEVKQDEQCLGKKAKNGKLIYEGDCIKKNKTILVIQYDVQKCMFITIAIQLLETRENIIVREKDIPFFLIKDPVTKFDFKEFKIIGDIYSNPELLTEK